MFGMSLVHCSELKEASRNDFTPAPVSKNHTRTWLIPIHILTSPAVILVGVCLQLVRLERLLDGRDTRRIDRSIVK